MSKYKTVAVLNIFSGVVEAGVAVIYALGVLPKTIVLYSTFDTKNQLYPVIFGGLGVILVLAVINFWLAAKLLSKTSLNKDKYFNYGVVWIVASFLLTGLCMAAIMFSSVFSIYSLTSEF